MNPSECSASLLSNLQNELKKYKTQNVNLQKQIRCLEKENNLKDRQLDEKSKCIITCISENLRLKQQLEALKKQLNSTAFATNPAVKRRSKKLGKRPKDIQLKRYSFDSNTEENVSVYQMPYFMPRISDSISAYSNVSEQACKLSFPAPNGPHPQAQHNQNNSGLSPIEEITNEYTFSPITVMSSSEFNCSFKMMPQSINNHHICEEEWGASIATCSISGTPSPRAMPMKNINVFHDSQVVSYAQSDGEDLMSSITSMTPSYMSYDNNLENVLIDKSVTVKLRNNYDTNSTILNVLDENKYANSDTLGTLEGSECDIAIID